MKLRGIDDDCFHLAVESSPAAMIMADSDGVIRFANAETEHMFGYAKEELIGKSIDLLVPAPLRHNHAALRRGFLANPSKRPMGDGRDLKGTRRDGTEFPLEIGLTPIETGAGLIVLAIVVDITGRREVENVLARRAAELERANERLAQFAYVASHDLQEPLRKIAIFSNVLDEAIACANRADILHANTVIRTSALHARDLVDDLLTFSRTINSEPQLQIFDLRDAIEFALTDLSESITETNARINIDMPSVAIKADRSQFVRLIQNIVSNAIKYRKPGRGASVEITAAPVGDTAHCLAIADDGIGFEEKYAQAIFEPFKRLNTKADYPGSGIGLAICKAIADRHGWRISVRSQPGEGATFFFVLPTSQRGSVESEPRS
ncbi:PAS domain S-box protein [Methylocapsa polymorpha]|uniref:histidine kinase n=1 Tax=Methylocapsa polymorpha TaxID=3080828 RepID=A0ABZ0HMQ5_9HYPH|nr:PAS domain S-box protein [Methylocapsa sp. RX1]